MHSIQGSRVWIFFLAALSASAYGALGFGVTRENHEGLVLCFSVIWGAYAWWIYRLPYLRHIEVIMLVICAMAFRVLFLWTLPGLSDDVYRFLWDARIGLIGANPFAFTPDQAMQSLPVQDADALYPLLNNHTSYSTYPPFTQMLSAAAVWLANDAGLRTEMLLLRIPVLIAELVTIGLLVLILRALGRSGRLALLYALNPLVVLELSANFHHEVYVIVFLMGMIYMALKRRHWLATFGLILAISVKILPLIHVPAWLFRWPRKTAVALGFAILAGSTLVLMPLASAGWSDGLGLYFHRFEFNPSLWAIVREIGYWFIGYNIIGFGGTALALAGGILILLISIREPVSFTTTEGVLKLLRVMVWTWFVYLLCATTVHPWYVVPLVPLGILAGIRFPLVWSALVMLTYFGYRAGGYHHDAWIGLTEYGFLFVFILVEFKIILRGQA